MWKKYAIKITKQYDDEVSSSYEINSKRKIDEIVSHIRSYPDVYKKSYQKRDNLSRQPSIEINTINERHPQNNKVEIIYEVKYIGSQVKSNFSELKSNFSKGIFISSLVLLVLFVFTMITTAIVVDKVVDENNAKTRCYRYFKNGEPESVEVGGIKYKLLPNGNFTPESEIFLNPYHRQILMYEECINVNLR